MDSQPSLLKSSALFFVGGTIAAVLTLAISAVFYSPQQSETFISILGLVLIEEILKLIILWFLIDWSNIEQDPRWQNFFILPVLFGVGFGLFEVFLISLNHNPIVLAALAPFVIHVITSILLMIGLFFFKKTESFVVPSLLFVLAITIHVFYNLVIISVTR